MKTKMTKKILLTVAAVAVVAVGAQAQIVYAQAGESITISSLTDASAQGGVTYEWYCNGTRINNCTEASCSIPVNMATGENVKFQRRATAQGCAVGNSANANTLTITFCNVVINGVCWADVHVDEWRTFASQADMHTTFYQFNRTKAWPAEGLSSVPSWPIVDEDAEWHADSSPCPAGWRLPTQDEYTALDGNSNPGGGVWAAAATAGKGNLVNGRFYGKRAGECTYPNDMVGCLFFPAPGFRNNTSGGITGRPTYGTGWSSKQATNTNSFALYFNDVSSTPAYSRSKTSAFTVRCVR